MKKIMILVLTLIFLLSLVACGANNVEESHSPIVDSPNVGPVTTDPNNTIPSETNEAAADGKLTLEEVLKAPESSESDFEIVDHGNGDVELLRYLGKDEIVVIPETVNGKKITTISSFVFGFQSSVKAIRFSDSITNVMTSAFATNSVLEVVVCGNGLKVLGEAAFQECASLHTVVLNEGLETIAGVCFGGCKSLLELEIPESVKEIQPMTFYNRPDNFKIIGAAGSVAEQYATSEDIPFETK